MAESAIEQEMFNYFTQLNDAEKKSLLEITKLFIKNHGQKPEKINIEQYNKEIDEALKRVSRGEFTTQEELEKEINEW